MSKEYFATVAFDVNKNEFGFMNEVFGKSKYTTRFNNFNRYEHADLIVVQDHHIWKMSRYCTLNDFDYDANYVTVPEDKALEKSINAKNIIDYLLKLKKENQILILIGEYASIYHSMKGFSIIGDSQHKEQGTGGDSYYIQHDIYEVGAKVKTADTKLTKLMNCHITVADYSKLTLPKNVTFQVWYETLFNNKDRHYKNYSDDEVEFEEKYEEPSVIYFPEDNVICAYDNIFTPLATANFVNSFSDKLNNII